MPTVFGFLFGAAFGVAFCLCFFAGFAFLSLPQQWLQVYYTTIGGSLKVVYI